MNNLNYLIYEHSFSKSRISEEFKCGICQKILNDVTKTPCNCSFCLKCIEQHLKNGHQFCPTMKESCQQHKLTLQDISKDEDKNMKLLQLVVTCPFKNCKYRTNLKQIECHLRVCPEQFLCPFNQIGCSSPLPTNGNILNHLHNEMYSHANLLMEFISNMQNEIKISKILIKDNRRSSSEEERKPYHDFDEESNFQKDPPPILLTPEESVIWKPNHNEVLPEEVSRLKSELVRFKSDFESLKSQSEQNQRFLEQMMLEMKVEIGNIKSEMNASRTKNEDRKVDSKLKLDKNPTIIRAPSKRIWEIVNFRDIRKRNHLIASGEFDSDTGHKMEFSLHPDNPKGFLSLYIRVYGKTQNKSSNVPFNGKIEIFIFSKFNPEAKSVKEMFCLIQENDRSQAFQFPHESLEEIGALGSDQIVVEFNFFKN